MKSSKKFKSQASSSRAATGAFGNSALGGFGGSGGIAPGFATSSSLLSYISEPPDFSKISNPQIVVATKLLLKKDSTTKTKALEDLHGLLFGENAQVETLEDGLIEAWIKVFPRTAIDNSRRVRQLAYQIQGNIAISAGKRIAKHISSVVGVWLAGLYDTDKIVQRAAQESFEKAFTTDEKRKNVWRVFQTSILEYGEDALIKQTPLTLSDERTVSPDDAQAKHAWVVATAALVLNRLIFTSTSFEKNQDALSSLLGNKKLWEYIFHSDAFVRRSMYMLLQTCVEKQENHLPWNYISAAVVGKGLNKSQVGSAQEFSNLLKLLAEMRPALWTLDYSGKSSAYKRLCQYLENGSQSAGAMYWQNAVAVITMLPAEVLGDSANDHDFIHLKQASGWASAYRAGINTRDAHGDRGQAWLSYHSLVSHLATRIASTDDRQQFFREHVHPVIENYVLANAETGDWNLPATDAITICVPLIQCLGQTPSDNSGSSESRIEIMKKIVDGLIEEVQILPPEQSKTWKSSQDKLISKADRLYTLISGLLIQNETENNQSLEPVDPVMQEHTDALINACAQALASRNWKPYGAAGTIRVIIQHTPVLAKSSKAIEGVLTQDVGLQMSSPSAEILVAIINLSRNFTGYKSALESVTDVLARKPEGHEPSRSAAVYFFASVNYSDIEDFSKLQKLLDSDSELTRAALKNPTLPKVTADHLSAAFVKEVFGDENLTRALENLKIITENSSSMQSTIESVQGSELHARLLFLSESHDPRVASTAALIEPRIKAAMEAKGDEDLGVKSTIHVIRRSLYELGTVSLSVKSIVDLATKVLDASSAAEPESWSEAFPSEADWNAVLEPFLQLPPDVCLAITTPINGATHVVNQDVAQDALQNLQDLHRDSNGYSSALRLTIYVCELAKRTDLISLITEAQKRALFLYFPVALQLVEDNLTISGSNLLAADSSPEVDKLFEETVSTGRGQIISYIGTEEGAQYVASLWEEQLQTMVGTAPKQYHFARVYDMIMSNIVDRTGAAKYTDSFPTWIKAIRTSPDILISASFLSVFKSYLAPTPSGVRLCNELVSEVTGLNLQKPQDGLRKLVLLNILLEGEDTIVANVQTQRLMFMVKHLMKCLASDEIPHSITSEILKLLTVIMPEIEEMYGSHWEEIVEFLLQLWSQDLSDDTRLPELHTSLRLYARLKKMAASEDCNEDLKEVWSDRTKEMGISLLDVLKTFDASEGGTHQPRDMTVELLARLVSQLPGNVLDGDLSEFYHLLAAKSKTVQKAAYDILHKYVPARQEKISFDAALEKIDVRLPDKLVSLATSIPDLDGLWEETPSAAACNDALRYLLSWKVIFDHFSNASLKVREDYAKQIKETESLDKVLNFTFEFLSAGHDKLINASKFDIKNFALDESASSEEEIQWLLIHLYFLTLEHLPRLALDWWIDSKKQFKSLVESWTIKYMSPLIISTSLSSVQDWATSQDTSEDYVLTVKISPHAAELTASMLVDEDADPICIAISLPPAYPLHQALVTGRHRVLASETKWRSWLMTVQGIIKFSNGSIIDGLLAFRKNVLGALKGQTECAICYSLISPDMQTPNKKCATCKKMFHSHCLFRWFRSSNQSSCPLCRTVFNYA